VLLCCVGDNFSWFYIHIGYTRCMIEHAKIFFPHATDKTVPFLELHAGTDGVKKIFFDREDKNTLVVTTEEGIATYTGFLVVCIKAYAANKED